jgi:hypothetical protein
MRMLGFADRQIDHRTLVVAMAYHTAFIVDHIPAILL